MFFLWHLLGRIDANMQKKFRGPAFLPATSMQPGNILYKSMPAHTFLNGTVNYRRCARMKVKYQQGNEKPTLNWKKKKKRNWIVISIIKETRERGICLFLWLMSRLTTFSFLFYWSELFVLQYRTSDSKITGVGVREVMYFNWTYFQHNSGAPDRVKALILLADPRHFLYYSQPCLPLVILIGGFYTSPVVDSASVAYGRPHNKTTKLHRFMFCHKFNF